MNQRASRVLDQMMSRKRELTSLTDADPRSTGRLRELRHWQAARLARTYRDLHRDPRHTAAVDFFFSDLYGDHDFAPRERNVERAMRYLKRSLPPVALEALGRAIELDLLTAELDQAMVAAIPVGDLDEALYAHAYRAVGRRAARQHQIELVIRIGEDLEQLVRHPWVGALLRAARVPAHVIGLDALQKFLERGYDAFRQMGDASRLLAAIRERETRLMEAILDGRAEPFSCLDRYATQ